MAFAGRKSWIKMNQLPPPNRSQPKQAFRLRRSLRARGDKRLINLLNRQKTSFAPRARGQTLSNKFITKVETVRSTRAGTNGRRNLTNDQRSILRGRRYNRTKKANDGSRGNQYTMAKEEVAVAKTAETIAKQHGVSERTIRSDGKIDTVP